ncbi:MAG: response regulator, partial [Shewanella fodinae]|nr:response regulator [Shewanella fodinae]
MTIPVLICDDSALARKQMARTLPKEWDIEITYATNGAEGLEAIKAGKGEVVFLDLNMPVMDGYEVLRTVQQQDLPAMIIVVSGDIQMQAHQRVKALGALDFIQKPVSADAITNILEEYGILTLAVTNAPATEEAPLL